MPRRALVTKYPNGPIQGLYLALNRALVDWFKWMQQALLAIPQLTVGDALDPDFDRQAQAEIAAYRETQARIRRNIAQQQVQNTMQTARQRWQALDAELQAAAQQARRQLEQFARNNAQRQIDAAASRARLRVALGDPPFGALQAPAERFARELSELIPDIGTQAARNVERLVLDVVARDGSPDEIRDILRTHLGITQRRANLIARHQCSSLESQLTTARAEHSGAVGFKWKHTEARHPRPDHLEKVGKIYPLTYRPLPRQEPNCQCGQEFIWAETS